MLQDLIKKYPEHKILIKFAYHCIWTHDVFQFAKKYCGNRSIRGWFGFDIELGTILHEYALLQIAKIHDPIKCGHHENHSFLKICSHYNADSDAIINNFLEDNKEFISSIRNARNKIIGHLDLKTTMGNITWGDFPEGSEDKYFSELHAAIKHLYGKADIGSFDEWPKIVDTDFEGFLRRIRIKGDRAVGRVSEA